MIVNEQLLACCWFQVELCKYLQKEGRYERGIEWESEVFYASTV